MIKRLHFYFTCLLFLGLTACGTSSGRPDFNDIPYLHFSSDTKEISEIDSTATLTFNVDYKVLEEHLNIENYAQLGNNVVEVHYSFPDIDTNKFKLSNSKPGVMEIDDENIGRPVFFDFTPKKNGKQTIILKYTIHKSEGSSKPITGHLKETIVVKIPFWIRALKILEDKALVFWSSLIGVVSVGTISFVRRKINGKNDAEIA